MAGWYVRRGEKILGPIPTAQIKEGYAAGKVLPTDEIAKDPAGPWTEVRKTSIAKADTPRAAQLPAVVEKPDLPAVVSPEPPPTKPTAVAVIKGGIVATWVSVTRTLSTRSQRKHELKLAKLQALAAQQPVMQGSPPHAASPPTIQTVVNVTNVNKNINKGGCVGCGGCGTLILLALITFVIIAVVAQLQKPVP